MYKVSESGKNIINFDPYDFKSLKKLIGQYGDTKDCFYGSNEKNERVKIGIWTDHIEVETYQANHYIRSNVYWIDGTTEELYMDKW